MAIAATAAIPRAIVKGLDIKAANCAVTVAHNDAVLTPSDPASAKLAATFFADSQVSSPAYPPPQYD